MGNVYGIEPGDVWFTASDVGWVVGHSYIVYAPLLTGATTVLYEGKPVGTPDASAFWRVIGDHGVKAMFTAPDGLPRHQARGPRRARSWPATTCRRSRPSSSPASGSTPTPTSGRAGVLGVPVVDNWWQTETGWPIAANLRGLEPMPIKPGSPSVRVPGYDVRILDDQGAEVPPGTEGAIAIRLPLPPGTLPTLWQDDERYVAGYLSVYDGYYLTGDGGLVDEDGYVYVMGRTDDVLNVAGHRLSTGSIEAALAGHPDVAECAVIGVADDFKGQVPRGLVVLKGGVDAAADGERIRAELVQRVRDEVGAVASLKQVDIVGGPAQDPLGQDPAQDDARDGRRQDAHGARHDRGRLGARRPRPGAAPRRLRRASAPPTLSRRRSGRRRGGVRLVRSGGGWCVPTCVRATSCRAAVDRSSASASTSTTAAADAASRLVASMTQLRASSSACPRCSCWACGNARTSAVRDPFRIGLSASSSSAASWWCAIVWQGSVRAMARARPAPVPPDEDDPVTDGSAERAAGRGTAPGVTPTSAVKSRVKWAWSYHP